MLILDRHKTDEDMRHSEIAESPGQLRNNLGECYGRTLCSKRIQEGCRSAGYAGCIQIRHDGRAVADKIPCQYRNDKQAQEHHRALDKVGYADCHKSAHKRVGQDNDYADCQRHMVIQTEYRCKQLASGSKRGSRIDEKEDRNNE